MKVFWASISYTELHDSPHPPIPQALTIQKFLNHPKKMMDNFIEVY
jgi:hypothetical protein